MKKYLCWQYLSLFLFTAACDSTLPGSGVSYPPEMPAFEKFSPMQPPYMVDCREIIEVKWYIGPPSENPDHWVWVAYFKEGAKYPMMLKLSVAPLNEVYWVDPGQDGT